MSLQADDRELEDERRFRDANKENRKQSWILGLPRDVTHVRVVQTRVLQLSSLSSQKADVPGGPGQLEMNVLLAGTITQRLRASAYGHHMVPIRPSYAII